MQNLYHTFKDANIMVLKLGHGDEYKGRLPDHEKPIYEQSTQKELGFRVHDILTKTKS